MLDVIVELLVVIWVVSFELWFVIVLEIHIDMINAQCSCLTHRVDVLAEDVLRHVGVVAIVDVGDSRGFHFAIGSQEGVGYYIRFAFEISYVSAVFADLR